MENSDVIEDTREEKDMVGEKNIREEKDMVGEKNTGEEKGMMEEKNIGEEKDMVGEKNTGEEKGIAPQAQIGNKGEWERVLLVGVDNGSLADDFARSMEELKSLAQACYMEPVGKVVQRMPSVHKSLYIGKGKVEEVREAIVRLEVDTVIFDDTLTPSQLRNLQDELGKPILDRTALILNIFEVRAKTREAKLQVESAKLKYLLPRLVGMHQALTRQGGTSGSMSSRGAGEKKLELDKRRIEHRIAELNRELEAISRERRVQRNKRIKSGIPLVALVGYTNAGKSTVMNAMLDAYGMDDEKKVLEKDMLFATLDTTVRNIHVGNGQDFLLSDTVGFIHKLPHGLVKAFRSTLEEVENADLLLHVVDCSDPAHREQAALTRQQLAQLHTADIPVLTVFNKADKCESSVGYPKMAGEDRIYISAKEPSSIKMLAEKILECVYQDDALAEFLIPYENGDVVSYLMEHARVISCKYEEQGTRIRVECHKADKDRYAGFAFPV